MADSLDVEAMIGRFKARALAVKQRRQDIERTNRDAAHHQRQDNAQLRQPGEGCENQQGTAAGGHAASYFGA